MRRRRFDCDRQWREIVARSPKQGAFPRQTVYGQAPGLIPFGEAFPDKLVQPGEYKEVIAECHTAKIFPVYHQHKTWAPSGKVWSQDGLNYCWAWGLTASVMDCRAREGKPTVELAPVSLGHLVGWKNAGNYLESAIRGATERGICSAAYVPDPYSRNYKSFKEDWEKDALKYRLAEQWDLDNSSTSKMIQHAISVLATGTPLYVAYNWWGHALECVAVEWDEKVPNNIVWVLRNSHSEDDVIELTGSRGIPSEAYGIRATLTLE